MKRTGWSLLLWFAVASASSTAGKRMSVEELTKVLQADKQANKSDADVSSDLKQVDLTEQLTSRQRDSLAGILPGPLSTEQIFVLEARSAMLPPPASQLPMTAAPDAPAQEAILNKASEYVTKSYAHLPHLTAMDLTAHFQDGVDAAHGDSGGMRSNMSGAGNPLWDQTSLVVRLVKSQKGPVESEGGIEKRPASKEKVQWGANGMVMPVGSPLELTTLFQEASASGSLKWLRWEEIDGKQIAVFSFSVDKKKTHYAVNYCCFPDNGSSSELNFGMARGGPTASSGSDHMTPGPDWKNFKGSNGYRGELFVDPNSGVIFRTVTEVDFKPSDFVRYEKIRTDYAPMTVSGKSLVVPVRVFANSELIANGEIFSAKTSLRHSFVTQTMKDYALVGTDVAGK